MEYDSRPKVKLFSFKDEKEETKDLFFASMKVMWIISIIAGLILGGLLFLVDPTVGIILAVVIIASMGYGTTYFNKKKEKYFSPLVSSIQHKLETHEISLTAEEVRELISQKEFRASAKNVLAVWTNGGEMSVFLIEDIKKAKEKNKKPEAFKVEVISEAPPEKKNTDEPSETDKDQEVSGLGENLAEGLDGTLESTPASKTNGGTQDKDEIPVAVTAVPSKHASVDAVSTNAINIVTPKVSVKSDGEPSTTPLTGSIGLIAPGVTGPIPITVGDHSVPYTGLGDHADKGVEVTTQPASSSTTADTPLRRPRHGRRSASVPKPE